jgi:ProP effector
MNTRNDRAPGDGALGGLRVADCDTHHATDRPQDKAHGRARALLTALRAKYPVLGEYRPLAIGTHAEAYAAAPGVTRKTIASALSLHCHSDAYLQAIAAGGPRYALDGAPSGEVCKEHRVAQCWSWRGERRRARLF